jgi:hypothetical protein
MILYIICDTVSVTKNSALCSFQVWAVSKIYETEYRYL